MIQKVEMFTIECDNCGQLFEDEDMGYCAWYDESEAWNNANDTGWTQEHDNHYCPDCYSYDDEDNLVLKDVPKNDG